MSYDEQQAEIERLKTSAVDLAEALQRKDQELKKVEAELDEWREKALHVAGKNQDLQTEIILKDRELADLRGVVEVARIHCEACGPNMPLTRALAAYRDKWGITRPD